MKVLNIFFQNLSFLSLLLLHGSIFYEKNAVFNQITISEYSENLFLQNGYVFSELIFPMNFRPPNFFPYPNPKFAMFDIKLQAVQTKFLARQSLN